MNVTQNEKSPTENTTDNLGPKEWDPYCERGIECCLDCTCPCIDSAHYRYRNARARGRSKIISILYAIRWIKV